MAHPHARLTPVTRLELVGEGGAGRVPGRGRPAVPGLPPDGAQVGAALPRRGAGGAVGSRRGASALAAADALGGGAPRLDPAPAHRLGPASPGLGAGHGPLYRLRRTAAGGVAPAGPPASGDASGGAL